MTTPLDDDSNRVLVQGDNIPADLLLIRRYGAPGRRLVNAFFDLNPGIADHGAFIRPGTWVTLPTLEDQPAAAPPLVDLFGDNESPA